MVGVECLRLEGGVQPAKGKSPGLSPAKKKRLEEWGRRKMDSMKYLIALLAIAGMAVSAMALHVHLMDQNAAPPCAVSEHWDCGLVGHSRYSVFPARTPDEPADSGKLHIPVAAVGIAGYAVIAIFALM